MALLVGIAAVFCLGVLIVWCMYTYNAFREKQSGIDFWWDEVDTHLQLRRDLIPSLLDRARPLMRPQHSILDRIAAIREEIVQAAVSANSLDVGRDIEHLENSLSAEMRSLGGAVRQNRDVQMNSSLLTVMGELVSIEGRAVTACEEYNKLTGEFNASIKRFPANLVVGLLHFNPLEKRIFGDWDEKAE